MPQLKKSGTKCGGECTTTRIQEDKERRKGVQKAIVQKRKAKQDTCYVNGNNNSDAKSEGNKTHTERSTGEPICRKDESKSK